MTASIRGGIFTMAMLLKGAEVAKALTEELHAKTEELKKNGVEPCLAILRVGAREDDLAYERGALKRCEKVGVAVRQVVLPEDVTQKVLTAQLRDMEAKGLLTRKVYAEVPPRVEYTLTKTGYSLKPILDSMVVWGTHYKEKAAAMEDDDAPDEA